MSGPNIKGSFPSKSVCQIWKQIPRDWGDTRSGSPQRLWGLGTVLKVRVYQKGGLPNTPGIPQDVTRATSRNKHERKLYCPHRISSPLPYSLWGFRWNMTACPVGVTAMKGNVPLKSSIISVTFQVSYRLIRVVTYHIVYQYMLFCEKCQSYKRKDKVKQQETGDPQCYSKKKSKKERKEKQNYQSMCWRNLKANLENCKSLKEIDSAVPELKT